MENQKIYLQKLSPKDFKRLSTLITDECAIRIPPSKKIMLEGRLRKRLKALDFQNFNEYCNYLFSPEGMDSELLHLIDAVTTNKTDFFREPDHYKFLVNTALPSLVTNMGSGIGSKLMVWSAGCSSGEEPYTLAMVLNEFRQKLPGLKFQFFILATDISTKVLERAKRAVYTEEKLSPVPLNLKKKYMLKSKDAKKKLGRIAPEVREQVRFRRLNFLEGDFGIREKMDIVFCRNVIIYFDKDNQQRILSRILDYMNPGGFLFLGHSESVGGLDLPLESVGTTVYRKIG